MAGPGKGNQEGGSNTEAAAFIFVVVVILAFWAIWMFARPVILYPAFLLDAASIYAIEFVKGLGPTGQRTKDYVTAVFDGRTDPWSGVTLDQFVAVRSLVGGQTRYVIVCIIAGLVAVILTKMRGHGYNRVFSLGGGKGKPLSLAMYQTGRWKTATSSANFDPDGRDQTIAPAATPLEWMRDNGIEYENSMLDRDATEEAFAKQLGKPWHGLKRADLIHATLAVLIGLHYLRRKEALTERENVNIAWANGQNGTSAMKALVEKYVGSGIEPKDKKLAETVDGIMAKHAYAHTGLFALLDKARARAGVLASADFLWLRWNDRTLHYVMNNVGRRRFHTEGAAVVSHFFAERVTGSPLPEPHVEEAINGVEDYLGEQGIMSMKEFFDAQRPD